MMERDEVDHSEGTRASTSPIDINTLMPFSLRVLLNLTTRRWGADGDAHPLLIRRIEALRADGWWVRTALPRNYLLWRHGRTMRDLRYPVLILPQSRGDVSTLSWNVFLAVEIVRAKEQLQRGGRPEFSALAMAELNDLVEHIAARSAVRVTDPLRLHQEVAVNCSSISGA
ncbi:hypothetical protein GC173_11625 [bacterium]|nr:hypothetical protein [bacterium]